MMILKKEVASQRNKNVDILNISSLICHKLSGKPATTFRRPWLVTHYPGLRFTSCQDGLARSAMAVTLEQTRILAREYNLKESEFQNTINLLRRYLIGLFFNLAIENLICSDGLQRENCQINTGTNRYLLTSVESQNLPRKYKPPVGSFGSYPSFCRK